MPTHFVPKSHTQIVAAAEALLQSAQKLTEVAAAMQAHKMETLWLDWSPARENYLQSAIKLGGHAKEELDPQLYAFRAGEQNPRLVVSKKSRRKQELRESQQGEKPLALSPPKKRGRPKKST